MEDERDWKCEAWARQLEYLKTLGSRPFDEIKKSKLFLLKKKVGFATCGKPSNLPNAENLFTGYNKEQLEIIKKICNKIVEKNDYDTIRFACTILILYHEGICETAVFRIVTKSGNIFIDAHARVYPNWDWFMKTNILPECEYCYPLGGVYNAESNEDFNFAMSPACGMISKGTACLDTAGSVAALAAGSVVAAGTVLTVAPVVATAAGATAVVTGVYGVSRSIYSLYDRNEHDQSVGLSDPESRAAWMSIASSSVGLATAGALRSAQKLVEGGKELGKLGMFGLHALNVSSLAFSGFGFVESIILCTDKYRKGVLTKKDVFDLSCELMFLFNAIASTRATSKLVNSMSAVAGSEAPSSQRKLTKTQKRNLRKRAAKRRAKGLSPIVPSESNETTVQKLAVVPEEKSQISFTHLKPILLMALRVFSPRIEKIIYNCNCIAHDIMSWKNDEIDDITLMKNLNENLGDLYYNFKEDIADIIDWIKTYIDKVISYIRSFFMESTEECRDIFCTKVNNMEDQLAEVINDAEGDITELLERLEINIESNSGDNESSEDDDFSPEAQNLLSACENLIANSSINCTDLLEFGDILDAVTYEIICEFKKKVSDYKKCLEEDIKSFLNEPFDINEFNLSFGIKGDVIQHFFNETMQSLMSKRMIYKIKVKYNDIKKERCATSTPLWSGLRKGMFLYYGSHGAGSLPRSDLLSVVSSVTKITVTEENMEKNLENEDVILIEVTNDQKVVVHNITLENTACIMIMIINLKQEDS